MNLLFLLLISCLGLCQAARWLMLGGYTNVEGSPNTRPLDTVELVTLDQEGQFASPGSWCYKSLSPLLRALDTATAAWVNTWDFLPAQLGNASYSSAHYTTAWARALVCGGGDSIYNVTRDCWWYLPVTDEWLSAPRMLKGRFEAVAVSLPGPSNGGQHPGGQVWMTGGREGSNILQKNEVLQYPALYSNTGTSPGFELKRWQWSNEKAKHTEIWNYGVRSTMYQLPIPLAGHCVVVVNNKFVVFLGGGTTEFKADDGSPIRMTGPVPTNHVHIYNLDTEAWTTTFLDQAGASLNKMTVGRLNHGCVSYSEGGRTKIMVAGGVTKTAQGDAVVTTSVEVMDWPTKTWTSQRALPRRLTGIQMIKTQNRPTILGQYNFEKQNIVLRYFPATKLWQTLETKLPDGGRSDFSVLKLPSNIKRGIPLNPNMNSGQTKINPGSCRTPDWRNKFNLVSGGKKIVWRTNAAIHAWIQLDLRATVRVVKVRFESGPVGPQSVEIRVTDTSVDGSQAANTLLTSGDSSEVCGGAGTTVDGVATMDVCCSHKGRYVTVQATDSTNSLALEVSEILVTAGGEGCHSADEALAAGNCVITPAAVSQYDTSRMGTGCPAAGTGK